MNSLAIRVDGNKYIGYGHFSRCLSIANYFIQQKVKVDFIVSSDSTVSSLDKKQSLIILKKTTYNAWNSEEMLSIFKKKKYDCLLVDSYYPDKHIIESISRFTKVFYIDDNYSIDFLVTGIINYNIEANVAKYKHTLPIKYFLGPRFFPLNHRFIKMKKKNNAVLIATGSTDSNKVAYKIAERLASKNLTETFYILIGIFYDEEYINEIHKLTKTYQNIKLLEWGDDFYDNFSSFKLVIGPGSTILYEALCLGIPCLSFSFVDNQKIECEALDSLNIARYVGSVFNTEDFLKKLANDFTVQIDPKNLASKQIYNRRFFDRHGLKRIFQAICSNT